MGSTGALQLGHVPSVQATSYGGGSLGLPGGGSLGSLVEVVPRGSGHFRYFPCFRYDQYYSAQQHPCMPIFPIHSCQYLQMKPAEWIAGGEGWGGVAVEAKPLPATISLHLHFFTCFSGRDPGDVMTEGTCKERTQKLHV